MNVAKTAVAIPMRGILVAAGGVFSASSRSSRKKATKMFMPAAHSIVMID